jgi:DNA-binding transcriptional regulator PaaX
MRKKFSIPERILILLVETGRTFDNPYQVMWERLNGQEPVRRESVRRGIDRLRAQGYLERAEEGDRVIYHVTDVGRRRVERYVFSKKRWDGRWRLVAYDIPERRRRARDVLRERLVELGFQPFQESVWIAPFDVLEEVARLRQEYRIRRYVQLLTVEVIEDHDRLMQKFGLRQSRRKRRKGST